MRHAVLPGALFFLCAVAPLCGADRTFPFEAAVAEREANVYSGPRTDDYYPTLTLRHGDRVTVVREDFGGWYLIQPLSESHSWIPVKDVEKKRDDLGMVIRETSDHIGSSVHAGEFDVMHRLFRGEVVRITGQSSLLINGSPIDMYRIEPPRGEYRYISRRDVLPVDEFESLPDLLKSARADRPATSVTLGPPDFGPAPDSPGPILPVVEQAATDAAERLLPPSSIVPEPKPEPIQPATPAEPQHSQLPSASAEGIALPGLGFESAGSVAPVDAGTTSQQRQVVDRTWELIQKIDERFRVMVQRPIPEWDLTSIENEYRVVAGEYENAAGLGGSSIIETRLNQRLAAVERRRQVFDEYQSFQQIVRRTEDRDAAIRQTYLSRFSVSTATPTRTLVRRPQQTASPAVQMQAVRQQQPRGAQFDGAGIVQRSAVQRPGLPTHVLVAPDGRVLTYLTAAPNIQLDRFVGRAMGIRGPRGFRPELKADLLAVHQLMPVTLRTR